MQTTNQKDKTSDFFFYLFIGAMISTAVLTVLYLAYLIIFE
jgi:hypothetical protein